MTAAVTPLILTDDQLTRAARALWAQAGRATTYRDLAWADDLLGPGGRQGLWGLLLEHGALTGEGETLQAAPLAEVIAGLHGHRRGEPELLWTLPEMLLTLVNGPAGGSSSPTPYLTGLIQIIDTAQTHLRLMSPYLAPSGVTAVSEALLRALARGVRTTLIAQDLHDLASLQSRAVEPLRQAAERLGAGLSVHSARHASGLLHAKLAVADQREVVLGSANMTGHGLGVNADNFEVGVRLGPLQAREVARVYDDLLASPLVAHVFTTRDEGRAG